MPAIAVKPYLFTNALFTVGADNYEAHVSTVRFTPSATTATFQGATPAASFSFAGAATWVCNLTYAQDWATPNSLSRYLHEHAGETVEVTFEPVKGGSAITATLSITPGEIGGDVNAVGTAQVALGVVGAPELEPVTP